METILSISGKPGLYKLPILPRCCPLTTRSVYTTAISANSSSGMTSSSTTASPISRPCSLPPRATTWMTAPSKDVYI